MVIPSIMIGFRSYGVGLGLIFLKLKIELIFMWAEKKYLKSRDDD
jgi:hypothetical protein